MLVALAMVGTACVLAPIDEDDTSATDPTEADDPTASSDPTAGSDPTENPDPTGGPAGEGCFDEPVANADFSLELEGWPAVSDWMYEISAECTVIDVQTAGGEVVTTLECDDAGELRTATMRIAEAPEGSPSWSAGSAVSLAYFWYDDTELQTGLYRSLSLRAAADGALLVAALDGDTLSHGDWLGDTPGEYLAPLATTEDREYCGWSGNDSAGAPMQVTFDLDGASLDLVHGQRGTLPIAGQTDVLALDLAEARVGFCCHYDTQFILLVRRVS